MRQGRILAGKYRLVAKLTEGGMGMVWRAEHMELGSPAAVKLLDPTIAESPEALARFKREAQSAASLRCTNIVQIFDFGVDGNMPYIAMELLRGKSLAEKLRADRQLSPVDTAAVLSQVARAAAWAHTRGIVHRDLKPGNIFLSEDAEDIVVKLLDFGIAKPLQIDLSSTPVTLTGSIMGTPQYMSPEQAAGKKLVDHRTDIWSFAIIAFECLTGRHAFRADTLGGLVLAICTEPLPKPSESAPVPAGFDEWFARAAHRDMEQRFSSIAEAAETLRFICGIESTGNHRVSTYDGTLVAELRAISTPSRGMPITDSNRATADMPSTTTLRRMLPQTRRAQVIWILGVLAVALTAVGSIMRFGGARHEVANASPAAANSEVAAPAASSASQSDPVAHTNPPIQDETRQGASSKTNSAAPDTLGPRRNPMAATRPALAANAASNKPNPARSAQTMSLVAEPRPTASASPSTNCDPSVKNRIGICPPAGK